MSRPTAYKGYCSLCHRGNAILLLGRHSSGETMYQCQSCGGYPPVKRARRTTRAEVYASAARSKARRNPIPSRASNEVRDAAKFAEAFHGRAPTDEFIAPKPRIPNALANIGKIRAIEYIAERDGKVYTFRHVFKAASRPYLAVAPDGKSVQMIGGSFEFTDRGFEDR